MLLIAGAALAEPPATRPAPIAQSAPATRPAPEIRPFQHGVGIDWKNRAVHVDARVVLRSGPLEFLACFGGKEHESILRLEASATHIYLALGLVGLQPGRPPRWDPDRQAYLPAEGDLVDLWIEFEEDGATRRVSGFDWTRAVEYGQPPAARPWVFAGSKTGPDGMLVADRTGEGAAVVDMPSSLLALARNYSSSNAELWLEADAAAIPPVNTRVRVILAPARPRTYKVSIDFRGAVFIDGRHADPAELADVIALNRRLDPECVQTIESDAAIESDLRRLSQVLRDAGVPASAFDIRAAEHDAR
jgi:hypothetical protein